MTQLPWMQVWPGDVLTKANHLSNEEFGALRRLVLGSWLRGGRLAHDDLARMACCSVKRWTRIEARIRPFFVVDANGDWSPDGVQKELEKAGKTYDTNARRAETGRRGRAAKKAKQINGSAATDRAVGRTADRAVDRAVDKAADRAVDKDRNRNTEEEKGSATHIAESPFHPDGSELGALPPRAGDAALAVGGLAAPPAHVAGAGAGPATSAGEVRAVTELPPLTSALLNSRLVQRGALTAQDVPAERMNGGDHDEPPPSQPFKADEVAAPKPVAAVLGGLAGKLKRRDWGDER